jgi:hypothetical protein
MIRSRVAFEVCKNSEQALHTEALEEGMDTRQIYSEDQVACHWLHRLKLLQS